MQYIDLEACNPQFATAGKRLRGCFVAGLDSGGYFACRTGIGPIRGELEARTANSAT